MNTNLDLLFYMSSQGNEKAYEELLNSFILQGKIICYGLLTRSNFSYLYPEDFTDLILDLFYIVINTFDNSTSRFVTYSCFILERRLKRCIFTEMNLPTGTILSLDEQVDEERPIIESIEDKELIPVANQVSLNRFKAVISSPNSYLYSNKLHYKVNMMLMAGYSRDEIRKALNLSIGELRYIIGKNKTDRVLSNLKLELK